MHNERTAELTEIRRRYSSTNVRHKLKDILVIILFAILANSDDWLQIELFIKEYQEYLSKYIELKNGIPSHDTLNHIMDLLSPKVLQQVYVKWEELLIKK